MRVGHVAPEVALAVPLAILKLSREKRCPFDATK